MTPDTVELRADEVDLLRRALDAYLVELKFAASRAEKRDAREYLWKFERDLEALRARLGE